ncbi:MFS transporter, partial [Candidatus Bathyarchaeota archaeon]|nr:MFS transporter [Candidatus Bathyarchaeota archaeon]
VYFCPESARWYMGKGKYDKAFDSMCRLRNAKIQASRDMYYAHKLLEIESKEREGRNLFKEFFTVRRNRRAAQSSWFVMFMQQFCGVNVIAYYSTSIFESAGYSRSDALLVSLGTGAVNWLFAVPAMYTIDTFGRRNLLLVTFPLMSLCLFFTGSSFFIDYPNAQLACIAVGMYLFMVVYSPGAGPVPFTYSAEAFPMHIRDIGMSSATAVTWGFNFIISFTWPKLQESFGSSGAFYWYAAWNILGWIFAYFLLPETKNLTLEELDMVFSMTNRKHAAYYAKKLPWYFKKLVGMDVKPMPELYQLDNASDLKAAGGDSSSEKVIEKKRTGSDPSDRHVEERDEPTQ